LLTAVAGGFKTIEATPGRKITGFKTLGPAWIGVDIDETDFRNLVGILSLDIG
jgi:hypothetical protein